MNAASRELFEETGSVVFDLVKLGIYRLDDSYGMVFYADVLEMDSLPDFEIAEIQFSDDLPRGLNYGAIYYHLFNKYLEIISTKELSKTRVNIG